MSSSPNSVIILSDITKRFVQKEQPVDVLRGVSFSVDSGQFVALQGTSGSGKSTILHILGLLDRPTSGSYLLDGRNVSSLNDDSLSQLRNRLFGFVFQNFHLIPYLSALENVLLPGLYNDSPQKLLRQRGIELLSQVGLSDRQHFKPSQLSGGQQQRVAIARSLLNDPKVILADEPTGQLDSKTSQEIMDLFRSIHGQGKTIILVTHDNNTASHAGRRIIISDGRVESDS